VFDSSPDYLRILIRDCLEVAIDVGLSKPTFLLCHNFKCQGGRTAQDRVDGAKKRKAQAKRVSEILLENYDLKKQLAVAMVYLNEDFSDANQALESLFNTPNLFPVTDLALPVTDRYTYFYGGGTAGEKLNQLYYIFMSKPLHKARIDFGFERRWIFDIDNISIGQGASAVVPFSSVVSFNTGASD
jgi:hypothetical protein